MNIRIILSTAALALAITSSNATMYTLSGSMDALQAGTNGGFGSFDAGVAGAGNGTGTIMGTYDDVTNLISYTLTWKDLTSAVTNAHFHRGAPGVGGGVDLGIPAPWTSPYSQSDVAVTDAGETNLLAGNWYVNIHTTNFRGGEIRGQVKVDRVPDSGATAVLGLLSLLGLVGLRRKLNA